MDAASPKKQKPFIVTVTDSVRLPKGLMGTVRFVGEMQDRTGIYYGIELTEAKGKSNGTVGNIRYFKCKNKRGLFLRFGRIQEVIANNTIHRIGINDCVELQMANRKAIGVVRYIGVPTRCKEIYYGLEFRKPIGDSDGSYNDTRYFKSAADCAHFVKASSTHIVKIDNDKFEQQEAATPDAATTKSDGGDDSQQNKASASRPIQVDIYAESSEDVEQPVFSVTVAANFSFSELVSSVGRMSQYISTVFELRFEPLPTDTVIERKTTLVLTEEQLLLLRKHSASFWMHGKFVVMEPLLKGIALEEKASYAEALAVYERIMHKKQDSTECLTYYANCLVLLDRFDEAEECYQKALDLNPFCGDICYFYSRLLEYRNKYDEAKNLCNRVMAYVKKAKSSVPAAHHAIHYACYARLSQKYVRLSMDRHNRSKLSTQQRLEQLIEEKKQLQYRIDALQHAKLEGAAGTQPHLRQLSELNQSIHKLEKQLLKKEQTLSDKEQLLEHKDSELLAKHNEIKVLKQSLSKFLAQSRLEQKNGQLPSPPTSTTTEESKQVESSSSSNNNTTKQDQPDVGADNNNNNNNNDIDIAEVVGEYRPLFAQLDRQKRDLDARRDRLLAGLLSCEKMKALVDCNDDEERQQLMCSKLELCAVCCDFQVSSSEEMTRVENKKDLLLEVLQAMSAHKWSSVQLLQQCIETIWENLFRSLPDASMIRTDANDDEMDFRDPSWDHLQLIYELTFHVVTNTNIDKKTMKKHLQGQFLEKLIHLFCSADDREPQYVKIIVHAIYGRFMALRKSIRKHLADYCFRYVYTSTLRDNTSWQGLPEILEIFCSIFQGLNVPVKPDYHVVLRNVIVPLHKSFHLDEFHEQLLQCCTQFVTKDPYSAPVILGGILKFWPKFSPLKEQLFITEIVHILNVCVRHPNIKQSDPAFATITIAVLNKFVECMTSPHHQVAERSLMVWRDETIRICVDLHREKIWPNIYQALQHNKEKYWLSAIRNINRQIMSDFKRRDPEFFEKIEQQQQSHDFNTTQTQQQKERKKLVREQRWMHLKQLAKPAQNV